VLPNGPAGSGGVDRASTDSFPELRYRISDRNAADLRLGIYLLPVSVIGRERLESVRIIPHCKPMLSISRPITCDSLAWQPPHSRFDRPCCQTAGHGRSARIAELVKDEPMGLLLLIVLLLVLFGGGFGYYRGGYYGRGGPVGIGGILGLVLVVLVIGWLVHGHIGGLYF
jgi:hypothetical protein